MQLVHLLRAFLPLVAGILATFWLIFLAKKNKFLTKGPFVFFIAYGLVTLLATFFFSPELVKGLYWGIAYLSVFSVIIMFFDYKGLSQLMMINRTIILTIFLAVFSFTLLLGINMLVPGPNADVFGFFGPNGIGRFAALAAITALIYFTYSNKSSRLFWAVLLTLGIAVLFHSQARAAIMAFLVSAFLFLIIKKPKWAKLVVAFAVLGLVILALINPQFLIGFVLKTPHLMDRVVTLSGRTEIWSSILNKVPESPLIGFGYHADRFLVKDHAHNAILHALIQGGIIGALFFLIGLLYALWMAWKALRSEKSKPIVLESAVLVFFFALRGLFESSGAFFGVDLLIMMPAIAFIQLYTSKMGEK